MRPSFEPTWAVARRCGVRTGRRHIEPFLIFLTVVGALLVGALVSGTGAAVPDPAPDLSAWGLLCPPVALEYGSARSSLRAEMDGAAASDVGAQPVRFDCGVGESWRHHVP